MFSVADLLELGPMKQANARVLAAHTALDAPVSWVHISEMEKLAHLFHGGEFLLTQGRGVPKDELGQRAWVNSLADAQIAGLAIEDNFSFDEIPQTLINEAEQRGLPLIQMKRPAYFIEITRAVHSKIINTEHASLLHAEQFGRRLSQLILAGGNLQEVMDEVASAISYPAILTDRTHMLQAFSPRTQPTFSAAHDWRKHAKHDHDLSSGVTASIAHTPEGDCLHQPIIAQGEVWGTLHVLLGDRPSNELTSRVLDRAVMSIGLSTASQQNLDYLATDVRSEILQDLLKTVAPARDETKERIRWLGMNSDTQVRVLIAEPLGSHSLPRTVLKGRQRFQALHTLTREIERRLPPGGIVGAYENRVAAIVPEHHDLVELRDFSTDNGVTAVIGCSDRTPVTSLVKASRDAVEALQYALEIGQSRGVYRAENLILERILLKLNEDGILKDIVEEELGILLDRDTKPNAPLLHTLEAVFECNGKLSDVAKRLNIDRRTVYHRLARIEKHTGENFHHPDKQLRLNLAVRGLRFLQGRAEV